MKPFRTGLICGRFQTLHDGHIRLIDCGLTLCERLLVLVGSAQLYGTEKNPFKLETRIEMIKKTYKNDYPEIIVYGIEDLSSNEDNINPQWGKYLIETAKIYLAEKPEIMIYGNDESRSTWFSKEDLKGVSELIVNRTELPISATMIRELMAKDDRENWKKYTDPAIHNMYNRLRSELMEIDYYKKIGESYGI